MSQANAEALETQLQAIAQAATREALANASAQLVALMPQLSEEPPLQAQAIDCCIDLLKANNPAAAAAPAAAPLPRCRPAGPARLDRLRLSCG